MKDWKGGFHLPNASPMCAGAWNVINAFADIGGAPEWFTFLTGEHIRREDIEAIIAIAPWAKFILRRWWLWPMSPLKRAWNRIKFALSLPIRPFTPTPDDYRAYIDKMIEDVQDWSWLGNRLYYQPWNEPNMVGGFEGFGDTVEDMERFNHWYCIAYDELKAANPDAWVVFPALTIGSRDTWFPSDEVGIPYYMHGPEAAKENPTPEEVEAAILSGPCYGALMRADAYTAHIYCINNPDAEIHALWCGLRWLEYARFFPKPMQIIIPEVGIGHRKTADYFKMLTGYGDDFLTPEQRAMVEGAAIWRLCVEVPGMDENMQILKNWVSTLPESDPPDIPPPPDGAGDGEEVQLRARVGVVGTNDHNWRPVEHEAAQRCKVECVGVMNFNNAADGNALLSWYPGMEFVVRLWSGGFGPGYHESPADFIEHTRIGLQAWLDLLGDRDIYVQIHNEPNLEIEGWGPTEEHAYGFRDWFLSVLGGLRVMFPQSNVHWGFPGLTPHANDLEWLDWCSEAIEASDFLCVHTYWTTGQHFHPEQGGRFGAYLSRWGHAKRIYITEFNDGSSDKDWDVAAQEYLDWYSWIIESSREDYGAGTPSILGACSFILGSHDAQFDRLMWVSRDGEIRAIVPAMEIMTWPPLFGEETPPPEIPVADFRGEPQDGDMPLAVQFTDLSTGDVDSWFWDFGDSWSSVGENPLHTYESAGIYTVALTVSGLGGDDTEIKENYITVMEPLPEPPVADFVGHPRAGDVPLIVQFSDLSLGKVDFWFWEFGDGNGSSKENPEHIYEAAGSYSVSLTVVGAGGNDTEAKTDYITVEEPWPPPGLRQFVRGLGWNLLGFSYNPKAAFPKAARKHDLGRPMSDEWTAMYEGFAVLIQVYERGVLFAEVGDWDNISYVKW